MLRKRIITAAILIPITLVVLFYLPPAAFLFLTAFITLGGAWEWSHLMGLQTLAGRWLYLFFTTFTMFGALFVPAQFILFAAFIWWLLAVVFVAAYPRFSGCWGQAFFWRGLMGQLVLLPCWASINYVRNQEDGIYALFFLFLLVWGADSAAYFAGRKWGKTKLAPQVSPGKSIEGLLGALVTTVVIAMAGLWISGTPLRLWWWGIALSLVTVLFSVLGDLFESMLKRQAGVKDSGAMLPGHGGLLDRIDSLTAAAPIFAFGAWCLAMYTY